MTRRRTAILAIATWDLAWRATAIAVAVKRRDWRWIAPLAAISSAGLLPIGYLALSARRGR